MAKKLEVSNLRVSFRTNSGTVKAVRGISFDLEEGETLAIVGESGSGKSVTSRAIMGILARNSIVEGGEIFYDGLDLLQISERTFHQLRGNDISMIFQDPLSSLNPIMRVGEQITEAMIANNKSRKRDAKKDLDIFTKAVKEACHNANSSSKIDSQMADFQRYMSNGNKIANSYNDAFDAVETTSKRVNNALIEIQGVNTKKIKSALTEILKDITGVYHEIGIQANDSAFKAAVDTLKTENAALKDDVTDTQRNTITAALQTIDQSLEKVLQSPTPHYTALGYAMDKSSKADVLSGYTEEKNKQYRERFVNEFLNPFAKTVEEGIAWEDNRARNAVSEAKTKLDQFTQELSSDFSIEKVEQNKNAIDEVVKKTINYLNINKDSLAYTFSDAIANQIKLYRKAEKDAIKDEKIARKISNKDLAKASEIDVEDKPAIIQGNIIRLFSRLSDAYESRLRVKRDAQAYSYELIEHMIALSAEKEYTLTPALAEARGIALMQEVGIDDARRRFRQYPFEFSGGMRQRVVIAIALSSNPDILICDEPTTALDVTIQAQILDLINELKEKHKLSVIFITHDLGVVANIADKIAVMYAGKIVEYGMVDEVFYEPAHPYTWALLSSMPDLHTKEKLESIPGVPPDMMFPPKGDAFAQRNRYAMAIDFEEHPPFFDITETHRAATWLLHPEAPKVDPPAIVLDRIARSKKAKGEENGKV